VFVVIPLAFSLLLLQVKFVWEAFSELINGIYEITYLISNTFLSFDMQPSLCCNNLVYIQLIGVARNFNWEGPKMKKSYDVSLVTFFR